MSNNKKGVMSNLMRILLFIFVFVLVSVATYKIAESLIN